MSRFEELLKLDVSDKAEKRTSGSSDLTYLSWAYAWAEFKKVYPDANYEIKKFKTFADDEKGMRLVPYMFDKNTGYMVNTSVTAGCQTYEMWLPVMNSTNKAMLDKPYTITSKNGKSTTVEAATMFDINKTLMRCLVKNIAMFGLGLYLYAGEDLPEKIVTLTEQEKVEKSKTLADEIVECKDQDKLKEIYQTNKKMIQSDPDLLTLITNQGKMLKGLVA